MGNMQHERGPIRDREIRIDGPCEPEARLIHGNAEKALRTAWSQAEHFVTSIPSVSIADATQLGRRKLRSIKAQLDGWPSLCMSSLEFFAGSITGLSPRRPCLLVLGDATKLDPSEGISSEGIWAPPGGWEDLVLVRQLRAIAWSSTHDRVSVFAAALLTDGAPVPKPYAAVQVRGQSLSVESAASLGGKGVRRCL